MDNGLLARLELLAKQSKGVSCQDFERLIKEDGNSSISVSELHKVFDFACDHFGFWEAEWSFSFADSPDNVAKMEREGWEILCHALFDSLVEKIPDARETLEGLRGRSLLLHAMRRRLEYNEGKTFKKLTGVLLSKMSFVFNRLGFRRIAESLYARALYPKGTIARP